MKPVITRTLCMVAMTAAILSCGRGKKAAEKQADDEAVKAAAVADSISQAELQKKKLTAQELLPNLPEEPVFEIVTNLGTMKVKLYSKTPLHRENFAKLAMEGFYDGLRFHRIIKDFMIQGGDPLSNDSTQVNLWGTGGPGYVIPAEILPNYYHKKGALAAARRGDAANPERESSGSQFYIVQSEAGCASLNGAYSVFGETIEGLDVIDKIASVATDKNARPLREVVIKAVNLSRESEDYARNKLLEGKK